MAKSARQQLIDLAQVLDIDYLLAPAKASDPLINLGVLEGLPEAELANGASLVEFGLLNDSAAVLLDGIDDSVELNWEPESLSKQVTYFGLSNLVDESDMSRVVAWFSKFEFGSELEFELEEKVVRGATKLQGSMFPFGVALRILTSEEIESLFLILSEISSTPWREIGVVIDSTITGVAPEISRTGVLGP